MQKMSDKFKKTIRALLLEFHEIDKDEETMSTIFEEFLRNFYKLHTDYRVRSRHYIWDIKTLDNSNINLIPIMKTDIGRWLNLIMKNAKGTRKNISIIKTVENQGIKAEILEYDALHGMSDTRSAQTLYFMSEQNMKARPVAVYMEDDSFKIEPGAMSYFQGEIEMTSGLTVGNVLGKAFSGMATGEKMARPEYKGSGMLVLEPTFKHILLVELGEGENIIVDKGMFYGAQGSVKIKAMSQKNISAGWLGGEGWFQISLTGPGVIVLESEVPMEEIDIIELDNDTLKVDGNFAMLRSGSIDFAVEKSGKTMMGSAVSGEGFVNVFKGTGQVWLAPTIKIYDTLKATFGMGLGSTKGMNMNTSNTK
ncbi:MAG: AIM24 family protein [Tissierella sp.]